MQSSSEKLSAGSQQIQATSEEMASTSQSMPKGASEQSKMITQIIEEMGNAEEIIVDIINKIDHNTETISQIALQTNILTLNAGIETSRAGDYGRGFAVVAENVWRLSEESKISADNSNEITEEIFSTLQTVFG